MLFKREILNGLRSGKVTVAFRRWRRPTVRGGGTLLTAVGELAITSVTPISAEDISLADAKRAGFESLESLLQELNRQPDGEVYRIELGSLRPDPRIALRQSAEIATEDLRDVSNRLDRLDARARGGFWTRRTLELLDTRPETRAGDLCVLLDQEKDLFKRNVRKLKNLGLTESLGVGYRLSPRGRSVLASLRKNDKRAT